MKTKVDTDSYCNFITILYGGKNKLKSGKNSFRQKKVFFHICMGKSSLMFFSFSISHFLIKTNLILSFFGLTNFVANFKVDNFWAVFFLKNVLEKARKINSCHKKSKKILTHILLFIGHRERIFCGAFHSPSQLQPGYCG